MGEVKDRAWEAGLSYALAVISCYAAVWAACAREEEIAFGYGLSTAIAFLLVQVLSSRQPLRLTVDKWALPGRPRAAEARARRHRRRAWSSQRSR
jgi:hypothetical protein